jgi:hypothetical protein
LGQRLADLLAERDRPALGEALGRLASPDKYQRFQKCNLRALRAKPPSLWLSIDVACLGTASGVPYLACFEVISRRRRSDELLHEVIAQPAAPRV